MSYQLELPDDIYSRLSHAAQEAGTTPIDWLDKNLPPESPGNNVTAETGEGQTMAEVLAPYIGKFHSGGALRASERVNELFGEYLEQKRREGRL
jgi:hypothetical protein